MTPTHEMHPHAGWYGKMLPLGDFTTRRLPAAWTSFCDAWLAQCLAASHVQLGSTWLDTYLRAPVWRFAWAAGVVDSHWWFGVLVPSCDAVGRYFPLVVAQSRERPPVDRIGLDHLELWWGSVADAALATLQEGSSVEAFDRALQALPPWPSVRAAAGIEGQVIAHRVRYEANSGADVATMAQAVAAQDLQARLAQCTIWSPAHGRGQAPAFTVIRGMPDASSFAQMLDGRW